MPLIQIDKITAGTYWVRIKKADVSILCASPASIVKSLIHKNYIEELNRTGRSEKIRPNIILLSDKTLQNNSLSNLTEFPLMHILYFQGILIPGHPNFGVRPMIVGKKKIIDAQLEYLFVGNYGTIAPEKLIPLCPDEWFARNLIALKKKFSHGVFQNYSDVLDTKPLDGSETLSLMNEVSIRRVENNIFEIAYQEEKQIVDLNLKSHERYDTTYTLPKAHIPNGYFSVTNTGLGDGWDPHRPCFCSMVSIAGKRYLIDAGPYINDTMESFGFTHDDIDGIFQTHVHDDHFGGYDYFWNSDKKTTVYSVAPVIRTIRKKLRHMFCTDAKEVSKRFNFVEMNYDAWFRLGELEIMPLNSPHPVETAIFMFRNNDQKPTKTYAHYGDLISFSILESFYKNDMTDDVRRFVKKVKHDYLIPTDLKKIDAGGGIIHGHSVDFKTDRSKIKVFGHTSRNLTDDEMAMGISEPYGYTQILIK